MANKLAMAFCRRLFGALYAKAPQETKEIYLEKLSRWFLQPAQWDAALDAILKDFENLPALSQIYPYLKNASVRSDDDYGWVSFKLNGILKTMRLRSVNGQWQHVVYRRVKDADFPFGKLVETHETETLRIPDGAVDVRYSADKPAYQGETHRDVSELLDPIPF